MIKRLLRFLRRLRGDWWIVRGSMWPYAEGFAVYNPKRGTVLETGLSREAAQTECDRLNKGGK